jgi:hypothetical protein
MAIYARLSWVLLHLRGYAEPAENENFVLSLAYARGGDTSRTALLENGIFPIYPDLFHRLVALLPGDPATAARLVSCCAVLACALAVFLYARQTTRSWALSIGAALAVYGSANHLLYFLIARADALFVLLGTLALICAALAGTRFSRPWACLAGVLAALSVLTKQTGLIYATLAPAAGALNFRGNGRSAWRLSLFFAASFLLAAGIYTLGVSPDVPTYFLNGLKIYAADGSWEHLALHLRIFAEQGYAAHFGLLLVLVLILKGPAPRAKAIMVLLLLAGLGASAKMWMNIGAVSNNFVLLSSVSSVVWIELYSRLDTANGRRAALACLAASVALLGFANVRRSDFGVHIARSLENGDADNLALGRKLEAFHAPILSDRLDYFVNAAHAVPEFESSVLTSLFLGQTGALPAASREDLKRLRDKIGRRIEERAYSLVLVGISAKNFLTAFPQIERCYRTVGSQPVQQGFFAFEVDLKVPKESCTN